MKRSGLPPCGKKPEEAERGPTKSLPAAPEDTLSPRERAAPLQLFWEFFKIGCFTFGGGWSIVSQIEQNYISRRQWMTSQELLDLTSVGRSLPGVMIGNVSFLFGYQIGGLRCGYACVLGIALPHLLILAFVTTMYSMLQGNPYVLHAMTGVRAAVAPIILSAAAMLRKGALERPACWAVAAGAFLLSLRYNVGSVQLVVLGMAAGLAVSWWDKRRGGRPHGAA